MRWLGLMAFAFGSLLFTSPASAQKLPSVYDGSRDGFLYNGKQNMPFKLYGVAIKWHLECLQGKVAQCVRLAEAFEQGLGDLESDMRVVIGYYMKACDQGSGPGCAKAATILRDGSAGFTNEEIAQKMAERGCNALKNQPSCAGMAVGLASGGGGAADPGRAAALVETACAAGADDGCRMKAVALFYDRADAASRTQALPMFENACNAKRAWGCLGLVDAYGEGWGVTKDGARAAEFARIGCTQAQGNRLRLCTLHGMNLARSSDKATLNRGEQYLDTSCRGGDAIACNRLGMIGLSQNGGQTTTVVEGLYYLRRGCDFNFGEACGSLSAAYTGGIEVSPDNAIALALLEKGCRLQHQWSCGEAKKLLAQNSSLRGFIPAIDPALTAGEQLKRAQQAATGGGDRTAAAQVVIRLMQEGNEDAAWLLGGWLYYGLPGVFDTSRRADGLILFGNAARVGHVDAAIFMGMAYWYGDGVGEDRAKGEHYMAIAASRGSAMASAILRSMKAEPIRQENARRQKEYEAWAAQREKDWSSSWARWTPSFTSSTFSPPAYTGRSVSQILDEGNWNQRINYLSGSSRACPSSNPYC